MEAEKHDEEEQAKYFRRRNEARMLLESHRKMMALREDMRQLSRAQKVQERDVG